MQDVEQPCANKSSGAHLERRRSERRLVMSMAAPPTRKRQLGMSIARLLPKYQFWVMFSVLITSARLFGYTCGKVVLHRIMEGNLCRTHVPQAKRLASYKTDLRRL